jgi:hypothetical protein
VLLGAFEPLLGVVRARVVGPVAVLFAEGGLIIPAMCPDPEDETRLAAEERSPGISRLPRRDVVPPSRKRNTSARRSCRTSIGVSASVISFGVLSAFFMYMLRK